ncbi:MAG: hypothetical protein ACI86X_000692 [Moritella sp.]|jgi:hypothetical protein
MTKIVLMMFLCVSLQSCSTLGEAPKADVPSILDNKPEVKKEPSGLAAISEFMAVMALIKAQTE